jgi:excisionase family DNA binding protein
MPARTSATISKEANHIGIEPISMRVNDACRFTGISRSTLYLLIASGDVEIIKLGASTLVVTESLRRFVNEKRRRIS